MRASLEVLDEQGIDGVKIVVIAERMGVTSGSSSPALAGGLYLNEFATPGMGTAPLSTMVSASFVLLSLDPARQGGAGLSDRVRLEEQPALEERMLDVRAALDAVGSE